MKIEKNKIKVLIYIIGLLAFQTIIYFLAKYTPIEPHIVGNDIDNYIPFLSIFIYPYIFWYVMLTLVPYTLYNYNKKSFNRYYLTIAISIILVAIIYVLYPTTMNRPLLEVNSLSTFITELIYKADTPIRNCLPSMHCLISFVFIYSSLDTKELPIIHKILIVTLSTLVILSTVFIKQHVLIDVITAFIISLVLYLFVSINKNLKNFNVIKH